MIRYLKCTDDDIEVLTKKNYIMTPEYINVKLVENGIFTYMTQYSTFIVYNTKTKLENVDWYVKKMINKDKQNIRLLKLKKLL